jgi:hypothetical protein
LDGFLKGAIAVIEQEVFMFSGLEREHMAQCRQRRVTWAWIEAREVMRRQSAPRHTMLTTSVLNRSDVNAEQEASWRDRLAAVVYRKLARQICEQFYDLSVLLARRGQSSQAVAASRMLSPALPSYCRNAVQAKAESIPSEKNDKARILTAVLPTQNEQRSAVLSPLRSRAA